MAENKYIDELTEITDTEIVNEDYIVVEDVSASETKKMKYQYVKSYGVVHPEWWGADPTGVADSSAAFQSAFDSGALVVQGTPGAIYSVANVTVPTTAGFHFDGRMCTIKPYGTPTRVFLIDDTAQIRFQTIENIIWNGSATSLIDVTGGNYQYLKFRNFNIIGGTGSQIINFLNDSSTYTPDAITVENISVGVWDWDHVCAFNDTAAYGFGGFTLKNIYHYTRAADSTIYSAGVVSCHRFTMEHIYSTGQVLSMGNCTTSDIRQIYSEPLYDSVAAINGVFTNCSFDNITMYWNSSTIGTAVDLFSGRFEHCNFKELSIGDAAKGLAAIKTIHLLANSDHNVFEDLTDAGAADNRAWYMVEDLGYRNVFRDGMNDRYTKAVNGITIDAATAVVTLMTIDAGTLEDGDGFKAEIVGHETGGNLFYFRVGGSSSGSTFNVIEIRPTGVCTFKIQINGRCYTSGANHYMVMDAMAEVFVQGATYHDTATGSVYTFVTDPINFLPSSNYMGISYYVPTITAGDVIYIDTATITPIYATGD
jgi:hypothetical protein